MKRLYDGGAGRVKPGRQLPGNSTRRGPAPAGPASATPAGPNFLGATGTIAAITISGDSARAATNVDLRLGTQSAQDFLAEFGVPPAP